MSWLHLVLLEGLPHSHITTMRVSSTAGSMVFFVGSTLLVPESPLSSAASLAQDKIGSEVDWLILGVLCIFWYKRAPRGPAKAAKIIISADVVMYCYSADVSRNLLFCVYEKRTWDTAGVHWPQGFLGSSPSAEGPQETPRVSNLSLSGILERGELLKADRLGFKAQLPCLLAVLFWVQYVTSLSL